MFGVFNRLGGSRILKFAIHFYWRVDMGIEI